LLVPIYPCSLVSGRRLTKATIAAITSLKQWPSSRQYPVTDAVPVSPIGGAPSELDPQTDDEDLNERRVLPPLRRRRRRPRGTAVRFIDGIAGPSEANVIGHSIISIGDIDQLSSDARKTCLPSQESYAERHFSIVSAASLEKIAHFHLPLSRMGSCGTRRQRNVQISTCGQGGGNA
jgi:hypothetical protein